MQLHFFTIPIHNGAQAAAELNRFLAGHKVAEIERQLVQDGRNSAWTVCVGIDQVGADNPAAPGAPGASGRRPRVDYKEVLNDEDFAVYSQLRSLRKDLADAEGIPIYTVFNNEQLAAMVRGRVTTVSGLADIDKVGPARVEKYGEPFLALLRELLPQTTATASGKPR